MVPNSKTHHNEGLNPCQPGFVTLEACGGSGSWLILRYAGTAAGCTGLAQLPPIHPRLRWGAASRLLGAVVATVGISAGKVEMWVIVGTAMGKAMEVIMDNILCGKTLHCQGNASRFICHALES